MRYAIVCDLSVPDFALIDFKEFLHSAWHIDPVEAALANEQEMGSCKNKNLHSLLTDPEAAADIALFQADTLEELQQLASKFSWDDYPELFI